MLFFSTSGTDFCGAIERCSLKLNKKKTKARLFPDFGLYWIVTWDYVTCKENVGLLVFPEFAF